MSHLLLSHLLMPGSHKSWGDSLLEEDELQQLQNQSAALDNENCLASELNMLAEASRDGINAMMTKLVTLSGTEVANEEEEEEQERQVAGQRGSGNAWGKPLVARSFSTPGQSSSSSSSGAKKRSANGSTRDNSESAHAHMTSPSAVAREKTTVLAHRRLARKPFASSSSTTTTTTSTEIVTPDKAGANTTSSSKSNNDSSKSTFVLIAKESRVRSSISYSIAAKGGVTTTTTSVDEQEHAVAEGEEKEEEEGAGSNSDAETDVTDARLDNSFAQASSSTTATTTTATSTIPGSNKGSKSKEHGKKRRVDSIVSVPSASRTASAPSSFASANTGSSSILKAPAAWAIPAASASQKAAWKKPSSVVTAPIAASSSLSISAAPSASVHSTSTPVSTPVATTTTTTTTTPSNFAGAVLRQSARMNSSTSSTSAATTTSTTNSVPTLMRTASASSNSSFKSSVPSSSWAAVASGSGSGASVGFGSGGSVVDLDGSIMSTGDAQSVFTSGGSIFGPPDAIKSEPLNDAKLARRAKDIDIGKALPGYALYTAAVPKESRDRRRREHPATPDRNEEISKRLWDSRVCTWKSLIHLWDHGDPIAALAAADLADAQMGVGPSSASSSSSSSSSTAAADALLDSALMAAPSVRRPKSRIIVPTPVETSTAAASE